jgi:hypothetical protein
MHEYAMTFMAEEQVRERLAEADRHRRLRTATPRTRRRLAIPRPTLRSVRRRVHLGQPA